MIGQVISHYRILERVGSGGMGEVYRAMDTLLQRPVALKFLPPDISRNPRAKSRFIHEARAASSLDHQNICTIHEINETADGRLYIVMACYEGETLRSRIDRGNLTVDGIADVAAQVARGLDRAHGSGIVHRDLKPSNVIVTSDGTAKIIDFGIATLAGETRSGTGATTAGTVAYMSPEQIRGERADARSDIWAFGVLLYEMYTGKLPFAGEHAAAMIYGILNVDPPPLRTLRPGIPEEIEGLVAACLHKDPGHRPAVMAECLAVLEKPRARSRYRWSVLRRRPSRRLLVGAAASLIVLGAAILALVLLPLRSPPGQRARVAILAFENRVSDSAAASWPALLRELLVDRLSMSRELSAIDPLSMSLAGAGIAGVPAAFDAEAIRLRVLALNADFVVSGRIEETRPGYALVMKIEQGRTAEVRYTHALPVTSEDDLPAAADSLAVQIVTFLQVENPALPHRADIQQWFPGRTHNVIALKEFALACDRIYAGQKGRENLTRAILADSMFLSPRFWLISSLVNSGMRDSARGHLAFLERHRARASDGEIAMIDWARAFVSSDASAQKAALEDALGHMPGNNILIYNLAVKQYILEEFESARDSLKPVVAMGWHFSPAHYLLGACYARLHDFQNARSVLERSLMLPTVYPETHALLSAIAAVEKDSVAAATARIRYMQSRGAWQNSMDEKYRILGEMHMSLGLPAAAMEYFRAALQINPSSAGHHESMGMAMVEIGDTMVARRELETALKLDRSLYVPFRGFGQLAEDQGDSVLAALWYRRYLTRDSLGPDARRVRERLLKLEM